MHTQNDHDDEVLRTHTSRTTHNNGAEKRSYEIITKGSFERPLAISLWRVKVEGDLRLEITKVSPKK